MFLDSKNEGNIISPQDEEKKILSEIADEENYVYLQSKNPKIENKVELRLENNFYKDLYKESRYLDSTSLQKFRISEKIQENIFFTRKNSIIDISEEKEFKIFEIIEEENEKK